MRKAKDARQQELFLCAQRPHHRTTTLTVDAKTFAALFALKIGEKMKVEFVNDVVSSAQGGNSLIHHAIRRIDLLRRQLSTAFRRVKVRTEMDTEIACLIEGGITGESDRCSAFATVTKRW